MYAPRCAAQNANILYALLVCGVFLILGGCVGETAHAQFAAPASLSTHAIEINPPHPAPGSTYTAHIAGEPLQLERANINWTIDGTSVPEFANSATASFNAGELGGAHTIRASFTHNGQAKNLSATVVPGAVDVVVEANTTAPYFYQGGRLPASGAEVRLIAVPHLYSSAGAFLAPRELLYRWSVNDRVAAEGVGRDTVSVTMPNSGDMFVTLTIESKNGTLSYKNTLRIQPASAIVRFYEENPLYGLARTAIGQTFMPSGEEATVRAEPYFASKDILSNAQYGWSLNGVPVQSDSTTPQSLTLQKVGQGGVAEVGFSIRNLNALLQYASGLFMVDFSDT